MFNDGIDADIRRFQTESEQNQFVKIIINRFACLTERQRNAAIHRRLVLFSVMSPQNGEQQIMEDGSLTGFTFWVRQVHS